MNDEQRRVLFDELMEIAGVARPAEEDEFTTGDFAEHAGISRGHAERVLAKLVKCGSLSVRQAVVNGRRALVYKRL